ncbi:hypothetical protein [Amantichitinum ursilacus]|uniref:DUF4124 domain-containing protein n=1 Tax=Amantichitinum ursilacus TaxID=857265 RepID=A0A0N0GQK2_9NEIS|nr:hypothetical protein [Amantichitinum ursilacus]KPC54720.1 hypothetical protein WG78_04080 [Amantichitinum ursilacus]
MSARRWLLLAALLAAAQAQAGQRYQWQCVDAQGKAAPGKTVAEALAPQQMHFIFSDGAAGRKLVGGRSDGVCSTATLILGEQKYACVPHKPIDGQGRAGKTLDRSTCQAGG